MKLRVLLFASLRDRSGRDWVEVELPPGATAAEVSVAVSRAVPDLRDRVPSCRLAVNEELVGPDRRLAEGDALALIPPVSGG